MSNVIYMGFGGNYAKAQALYNEASELDESPATYAKAKRLYQRAIKLRPNFAIAWVNLGNIHYREHDFRKAEQHYKTALRFEPDCPEANYNLGYFELDAGRATEAVDLLKRAIEADPQFADAHFNLAKAYEHLGQMKKAQPHWRTYLNLEPTSQWADIARRYLR